MLEGLHLDRTRALLVALCVVLLVAGFVVGRSVGGNDAPVLQTPAVAAAKAGDQPALVVPSPISIPKRPKR